MSTFFLPFSSFSFTHPPLHLSNQFPFSTLSTLTADTPRRFVPLGVVGTLGSPVVGSANFFLSYRAGGSRCDAGLQSELIIACRNCAAARRVHIIQLARGPAASLARANASIDSLSPSSQDHSRRARCLPPPLLDPSICKLSRARRHWPTRAVPPQGSSSFVGPANRPCPLPFSRTSTPRYSKYSISFLEELKLKKFEEWSWGNL